MFRDENAEEPTIDEAQKAKSFSMNSIKWMRIFHEDQTI